MLGWDLSVAFVKACADAAGKRRVGCIKDLPSRRQSARMGFLEAHGAHEQRREPAGVAGNGEAL